MGQHLWSFFLMLKSYEVVGHGWWWWVYLDYSVSSGRFFDHELNLTRTMDQDQDQSLTIKFSEKVQIFHKDQLVLGSLIIN